MTADHHLARLVLDDISVRLTGPLDIGQSGDCVGRAHSSIRVTAGKDRQRGDQRSGACVQTLLAVIMPDQRACERAEQLLQEALATYREVGDESDAIGPLLFLGQAAAEQGKSTQGALPAGRACRPTYPGLTAKRSGNGERSVSLCPGQSDDWGSQRVRSLSAVWEKCGGSNTPTVGIDPVR
jgi:hypothetical protein